MQSTYITRLAKPADLPALPAIEDSAGTLFRTIEGLEALADDEPLSVERLREILDIGKIWVAVHVGTRQPESDRSNHQNSGTTTNEEPETGTVVGFLAAFPLQHTDPSPSPSRSPSLSAIQPQSRRQYLHIAELSIHAEHHRRGLGRRLMADLISYAEDVKNLKGPTAKPSSAGPASSTKQAKVDALTLTTYRDVPFNGPFYAKMGFRNTPVDGIQAVFGTNARRIWDEEQASIPRREGRVWMAHWIG